MKQLVWVVMSKSSRVFLLFQWFFQVFLPVLLSLDGSSPDQGKLYVASDYLGLLVVSAAFYGFFFRLFDTACGSQAFFLMFVLGALSDLGGGVASLFSSNPWIVITGVVVARLLSAMLFSRRASNTIELTR